MVFSSSLFSPTSPPNQKMCWLKDQSSTLDFEHILLVLKMTTYEKFSTKFGMMQDNGIESSDKGKQETFSVFLRFVLVYEMKENNKYAF